MSKNVHTQPTNHVNIRKSLKIIKLSRHIAIKIELGTTIRNRFALFVSQTWRILLCATKSKALCYKYHHNIGDRWYSTLGRVRYYGSGQTEKEIHLARFHFCSRFRPGRIASSSYLWKFSVVGSSTKKAWPDYRLLSVTNKTNQNSTWNVFDLIFFQFQHRYKFSFD